MKPRYRHDCNSCVWVGSVNAPGRLADGSCPMLYADLYCCGKGFQTSIIARFSSKGSDYASMPANLFVQHYIDKTPEDFSTAAPFLMAAYYFAKAKGVL